MSPPDTENMLTTLYSSHPPRALLEALKHPFPGYVHFLEASAFPGLWPLSLHHLMPFPLPLTLLGPLDDPGSSPISGSVTLITSAQSLLTGSVTSSQTRGVRTRMSLGAHYSPSGCPWGRGSSESLGCGCGVHTPSGLPTPSGGSCPAPPSLHPPMGLATVGARGGSARTLWAETACWRRTPSTRPHWDPMPQKVSSP